MRWMWTAVVPLIGLGACSEYDLGTGLPGATVQDGAGEASPGDANQGTVPGSGTGGGEPTEEDRTPPEFGDEACEGGILATWMSGELVRFASDTAAAVGVLDAPTADVYDVYDIAPAESGASQWNESMYLRIPTATVPDGLPFFATCGDDWFVLDPDNYGALPAGTTQYLGTFWLEQGENTVEMFHACPRILAGECPDQHFEDDPGSTCESGNVNSVHLTGAAICLIPA